jgi:hypothetical protein
MRATEQLRENCARSTLQTLDQEAAFSSSLFTGPFLYYLASAIPAAAASIRRFIKFLYTRPTPGAAEAETLREAGEQDRPRMAQGRNNPDDTPPDADSDRSATPRDDCPIGSSYGTRIVQAWNRCSR